MQQAILAIDEGTTNVKALLIDKQGAVIGKGNAPLSIQFPVEGYVEQDPIEILEKVKDAIQLAIASVCSNDNAEKECTIESVAISNQRESVVVWDRITGEPLTQVISWQCRRSESLCAKLRENEVFSAHVHDSTGLMLDPMFPATKVAMALKTIPNCWERAKNGEICIGTINSWLIWNMTDQVFVTDTSNAARTQLFNIRDLVWDATILEQLEIPYEALPLVVPSSFRIGVTSGFGVLESGIPISSQIGDSHAALFGHGGFQDGVVKATYGTGSSVMAAMPEFPFVRDEISTTIAWQNATVFYGLEGNITHTGSAIDWVRRLLGVEDMDTMCELAAQASKDHSVYFVPALSGLGAPYWDLDATGIFCGLKSGTERADVARSAFESVIFQVADVFDVIRDTLKDPIRYLSVDGGPTRNDWLMQAQADLLGVVIKRGEIAEVSALGAACLAGLDIGWWKSEEELVTLEGDVTLFEPDMQKHEYWQDRYKSWKKAVAQCRLKSAP